MGVRWLLYLVDSLSILWLLIRTTICAKFQICVQLVFSLKSAEKVVFGVTHLCVMNDNS